MRAIAKVFHAMASKRVSSSGPMMPRADDQRMTLPQYDREALRGSTLAPH